MSPQVPLGPFHPALEEPYKIEVTCDGETITDSRITVGFNFRGIEWLAERKNYTQGIALLERVCGICSNVHSMMYCRAVEAIADLEVPPRARYIRTVVSELERLHSHLLWAGVACNLIGFETLFMTCFSLREKVMETLEAISGNRVNYAMNCPGGVNRDITDPGAVLAAAKLIGDVTSRKLIPVMTANPMVRSRCRGVGPLSREDAIAYGAVGPLARASGVPTDLRRSAPYDAYGDLSFDVPVQTEGDVFARIVVRALEILESCKLIEQAIETMPSGPISQGHFPRVPEGEATVRMEAPRGEVIYYMAAGGGDTPTRVKVRTPTFANMPTVQRMVLGQGISDLGLIQASIDPCYSCTDR